MLKTVLEVGVKVPETKTKPAECKARPGTMKQENFRTPPNLKDSLTTIRDTIAYKKD